MLLDKIPADMIHIDSGIIGRVDQKTLQDKIEERNKNIVSSQPALHLQIDGKHGPG